MNMFYNKFRFLSFFYSIIFLSFLSCKKHEALDDSNKENIKRYYYKYEDAELGYFKGNISPIIGGDMRNLLGSVKIYSEDLRLNNPNKEYRVVFNVINDGEYLKKYSEQKIILKMNLTNIEHNKEYNISLNNIDFRKQGVNWIYTTLQYTNYNKVDKIINYIPNHIPISILITKISKDPYYQIHVIEGHVKGVLYNYENKNDTLKLNFDFKSRYYELFERQ